MASMICDEFPLATAFCIAANIAANV